MTNFRVGDKVIAITPEAVDLFRVKGIENFATITRIRKGNIRYPIELTAGPNFDRVAVKAEEITLFDDEV